MRRTFLVMTAFCAAGAAMAGPVGNANGAVSGRFGDTEIDMPALCEQAPFAVVRTHDGGGTPSVEVALPGGIASIEVRTDAGVHQFGKTLDDDGFPLTLAGEVNGIDYQLMLECPKGFGG